MTPPIFSSSPIPNGHGSGQGEERNEDDEQFVDPDPDNLVDAADIENLYSSPQGGPTQGFGVFQEVLIEPVGAQVDAHTDYLNRYDITSSQLRNVTATPGFTPGGNQGLTTPQFVPFEMKQGTTSTLRSGDLKTTDENYTPDK